MNKITPKFVQESNIIYVIILILFIIVFIIEGFVKYAILGSFILIVISFYLLKNQQSIEKNLNSYLIEYTKNLENISVSFLYDSPIPISIIDTSGKFLWFNNKFKEVLGEDYSSIERIEQFNKDFPLDSFGKNKEGTVCNLEVHKDAKSYNLTYYQLESGKYGDDISYILYWIENTSYVNLKTKYTDERPIAILIQIDNYEEISEKLDKGEKLSMTAEVEKILNKYASEMNGFVFRYDTYKFLMMIENKYLDILESKKFSMLEDVKLLKGGGDFNFTLSIGTGALAKNLTQLIEYAKGALDVALGRGGDQAVVKRINSVKFYGGKSRAVEKRNKVKARIISYALRQIIDQSSNVVIIGHRVGDMDSLGSSIGLYAIARSRNKNAYIVLNSVNHGLKNMYERMKKEESHYHNAIITSEIANEIIDQNTLIVVLDTHRKSYTEAPELLEKRDKLVLIDHHRRSEEYIENTVLDYIEPYASSTSELVSEIVQYMEDHIRLTKFEADALLAGIVVDTNSFTTNTGVRTFEAASFLRKNGADTEDVKQLFNESLESMKKKTEVIERSELLFGDVAVSYIDKESEDSNVIAAQSADELLTIKGVKLSFVLVKNKDYINISARSDRDENVQLIMEKLGGGGHSNMAGAQIKTDTIDEAKAMLYEAINNYKEEIKNK